VNLFVTRREAAPLNSNPLFSFRFNASTAASPAVLSTDSLTLATARSLTKVADQDALVITAKAGDTYWGLARRFAATMSPDGVPTATEINAYVKDLQAANGKSAKIRIGQSIKLPMSDHATWKLPAMVAAQKSLGKAASAYDWSRADAQWGYAESIEVTAPSLKGGKALGLAVREFGPTKGGSLFQVEAIQPLDAPREVTLAASEPLVITAKPGDSYWALARRFAATSSADGVPSATEIKAYVADLQAVNGKTLKAGLAVKLPRTANATWQLEALAAVQQDFEARKQAGEKLPVFDWAKAEVRWGYAEAMEVTVSPMQGGTPESLAVHATGRDRYTVQSLAEYYRQNGLAD
jgi:LysM repeat protein